MKMPVVKYIDFGRRTYSGQRKNVSINKVYAKELAMCEKFNWKNWIR